MKHKWLGSYLLGLPFLLFLFLILIWPTGQSDRLINTKADGWISLTDSVTADLNYEQKFQDKLLSDRKLAEADRALSNATPENLEAAKADMDKALEEWKKATNALETIDKPASVSMSNTVFFGPVHPELLLLLIVLTAGALGSSVFTARSFAYHVGADDFKDTFVWWYFLRLPVGMGIAFILYIALRGGLFAGSFANNQNAIDNINPYGFAAISALSGMFSKQATDKLAEIFDNIFRTERDIPDAPGIKRLSSKKLAKGVSGEDLKIKILGTNFSKNSVVHVNGQQRTTVFKSPTELEVELSAADVAKAGKLVLIVKNGPKSGGNSEPDEITVTG